MYNYGYEIFFSVQIGDFKFAVAVCKKLIDFGFPPAWAVCRYMYITLNIIICT